MLEVGKNMRCESQQGMIIKPKFIRVVVIKNSFCKHNYTLILGMPIITE